MQYIKECLQLLYWIYFKPYTLRRHVQAICPEITDPYDDNIYKRSTAAKANPQLQRYDDQGWWLMALVPMVIAFAYVPLAEEIVHFLSGADILQFSWWKISCLFFGWLLGQVLARAMRRRLNKNAGDWVFIAAMILVVAAAFLFKQYTADNLVLLAVRLVVLCVALGVGLGLGVDVATGVAISVMLLGGAVTVVIGIDVGVMLDVALSFMVCVGVVLGVALSVGAEVGEDVAFWMMFGVVVSVVVDVMGGLALGISFILGVLRLCFWLPELILLLLLDLLPLRPAFRLPVLPPRFDQLIRLPLPLMARFIAESYQENRTAARQAIDYLITSTNQQKAARKAMSLIAIEECSHCQTVRDIAWIQEQLFWLSEKPSLGLAVCLDISQDVNVTLEASSPYRKAQQMDKIVEKIDRQRNSLASASAREATSFGSVLDSWQDILEAARKTLREQAAQNNKISQVYLVGPALDPNKAGPLFKGRRDLFRQIETLTLSAQHPTLVMHGGRRCGKTSTLNYLPKWLPSDILPLLIDGQSLAATSTLSGFAEEFADLISKSARKVHSLQLPALDSVTSSDDPFVTLRRWLDAVEEAVPDKTLLLCLDEFERLDEIVRSTDSRAPLNFLRHLIQHRERWTLLFTGVLTPEELPAYWSDYLINCETLRVSYLAEADCLELIQHPVEDFPDIYPAPVAHAIRDLTGGQPYFTQLLCHELVEQLNRKKAKTVQIDDLQMVLPAVFERGYQVFREFWQSLTDPQRVLLRAVAEAKAPTKAPSEEAMQAASVLVRKEILAPENGGWCFRVPLICHWLLEEQGGLS